MKIFKSIFIITVIFMLGIFNAIAADPPMPSPMGRRRPPPPPGLPIDEHIFIVIILAVLFGIFIINNFRLKTKTPI